MLINKKASTAIVNSAVSPTKDKVDLLESLNCFSLFTATFADIIIRLMINKV